eukprot:gene9740-9898_t
MYALTEVADLACVEDDVCLALADVPSTWRQYKQPTSCKATATDPIPQQDAEVQSSDRSDAAVQVAASQASAATNPSASARLDAASLLQFLMRAVPGMLQELSASPQEQRAGLAQQARQSVAKDSAQCLFSLWAFTDELSSAADSKPNKHQLQVTSISWSKTGHTIAASFGRFDVSGWCVLPGAVATWNLSRPGLMPGGPDRFISTDSCIMCLAFHPAEPALIAAGTYDGRVIIIDLNEDDASALVAQTNVLKEVRHREPITAISWQFSSQQARKHGAASTSYRLFTLGADGRLLVWQWNRLADPIFGCVFVTGGAGLASDGGNYELRPVGRDLGNGGSSSSMCLGGTALAFCPNASGGEEVGLCLIATEGRHVLRCQLSHMTDASLREFAARLDASSTAAAAGSGSSKVELRSAVREGQHQALAASVNDLTGCPHHRQLALTAGSDGSLCVLDVLASSPLLLLEPSSQPLLRVGWSPSRPLVFAAGAADGVIHLYDLAARQRLIRPVAQLQVAETISGNTQHQHQQPPHLPGQAIRGTRTRSLPGVHALAFNPVVAGLLAAAAGDQVKTGWRELDKVVNSWQYDVLTTWYRC